MCVQPRGMAMPKPGIIYPKGDMELFQVGYFQNVKSTSGGCSTTAKRRDDNITTLCFRIDSTENNIAFLFYIWLTKSAFGTKRADWPGAGNFLFSRSVIFFLSSSDSLKHTGNHGHTKTITSWRKKKLAKQKVVTSNFHSLDPKTHDIVLPRIWGQATRFLPIPAISWIGIEYKNTFYTVHARALSYLRVASKASFCCKSFFCFALSAASIVAYCSPMAWACTRIRNCYWR